MVETKWKDKQIMTDEEEERYCRAERQMFKDSERETTEDR